MSHLGSYYTYRLTVYRCRNYILVLYYYTPNIISKAHAAYTFRCLVKEPWSSVCDKHHMLSLYSSALQPVWEKLVASLRPRLAKAIAGRELQVSPPCYLKIQVREHGLALL